MSDASGDLPPAEPPAAPRRRPRKARTPLPASKSLPDDGHSLFLGWDGTDTVKPFGFRADVAAQARAALTYAGDGHLMTVAPTGAGKGVGVIIPTLLTYPGSIIVTDIKGENYQVTARHRREMGHQVVALDPFGLAAEETDRLNPFDLFDLPGADPEADAEMLAAQLAVGHEFTSDRYWEDTGRGLVAGLIAHIATTYDGPKRNLSALRQLLYNDDLDYTLAVALDTLKENMSPLARDEFVAYLAAPSDKTRPCIRTTSITFVKCLGCQAVARSLERSTFALADLLNNKPITVYLILPPEKLSSHRGLLRLWVTTLLTTVMRRKRLPRQRTLFMLDEASQLGALDLLPQAVSLLRGYGLQVWTFWQDLSQLTRLYPKEWESVVNNAAVLQVFGVPGHAARSGWRSVLDEADAAHAMELPATEMLVAQTGVGCRRHTRANYLSDPAFAGRFDRNERFAGWDEPAKQGRAR